MDTNQIAIAVISGLLIIVGAIGSVLPILPGPPLSYAGFLLYAWYTGFDEITIPILVIFGILTALTFVIDVVAPSLGAKGYKASKYGSIGAMVGAFAGIFILGPLGIIIGPFIGAFVGELAYTRNVDNATKVGWGSLIGFIIGSLFKMAVITGMFAYFIYTLF